jgi:predicted  nucleic acid-binding Zn-ribbon protein
MQSENRNLHADLDSLREQFEEEQESKADVQRQLSKSNNEVQVWRSKAESGGGASSEAVEELRYMTTFR